MRQLSMKPANIKRRMSRLATDSVGWLVEKRCLLLATGVDAVIKRDARMIVRARKGNGYARNFCKVHGLAYTYKDSTSRPRQENAYEKGPKRRCRHRGL